MEWSTHFLSGVVAGYAVSGGDWRGEVVGGIAGVVPDLDEHKSRFGKVFFPISFIINKIFGHRTLTHSLLFAVGIGFILSMFFDSYIWQSATFGILAHIAGDMLTGKVQLLNPSKMAIGIGVGDRKSTRLNSSHVSISYAVFCLKKKTKIIIHNI